MSKHNKNKSQDTQCETIVVYEGMKENRPGVGRAEKK